MFKILEVDLTNKRVLEDTISQDYSKYLGGRGLAVRLFTDLMGSNVEPLSPENMIIFSTGALINSKIPMSGRSNATTISPLTNTIFSSNVGGMFGKNLTSTGFDVLVISGSSEEPLYLVMDKKSQLENAKKLWGKDVFQSTEYLIKKHGVSEGNCAVIGPAGENQNFFGNIMVQRHRAFGRGGLGAVLGSKRLKAIVFKGKQKRTEPKFKDMAKRLRDKVAKIDSKLKTQGTSTIVNTANKNEAFPTRFYVTNKFKYAGNINGNKMETHKVKSGTCYSCPVACKMITKSEKYDIVTDGPEYETIVFFGSNLGMSNLDSIIKSNDLCDRFGLDTISTGAIIGAFIETVKKKKRKYKISWDDEKKVHELIVKIANTRGVGRELQKGTDAFCKKYGIKAQTVKSLDVPGHDPRALHGQALSYAVSNRGADHLYSTTYKDEYNHPKRREIKGKAKLVIRNENRNAVLDSLGLCKFSTSFYKDDDYLEIMSVLLERDVNMEEFQKIGSEIVNRERTFNNKRDFDSKDDILPKRLDNPNLKKGLAEYYKLRGWSKDGRVKEEK
ncbi:MAG: aldehyde ferredoxin oxidoreductase family protein [Thermoplasmata archaeon]|nr:MAG: aldehyde ferredoxin oxidoreductase family protein [Thermoplasmata archaeon]